MPIFSVILLSIAANLDNLSIGLAYGIRKVRIPFLSNLVISSLSGVFTLVTCLTGQLLRGILPDHLGNILGGCIVCIMGIWVIAGYLKDKRKKGSRTGLSEPRQDNPNVGEFLDIMQHPEKADMDYSGDISAKESLLLGTALALNCLATGLGAGMTGLNAIGIAAATILFSFLTISLGLIIGKRYASGASGEKATIFAGALLIILGLYEAFIS